MASYEIHLYVGAGYEPSVLRDRGAKRSHSTITGRYIGFKQDKASNC